VQAVADDEIARLLAVLPVVKKSARHRECPICLEASEAGDSAEEEEGECDDDGSNEDGDKDARAKGWVGLPCAHIFHADCLKRWFQQSVHKRTCPLCRLDLCSPGSGTSDGEGHADATNSVSSTPRAQDHLRASPELHSSGTQHVQPLSGIAGDEPREA
jgi:hypothetical protein